MPRVGVRRISERSSEGERFSFSGTEVRTESCCVHKNVCPGNLRVNSMILLSYSLSNKLKSKGYDGVLHGFGEGFFR